MTKKRDFKMLVRERMTKTGERYATARAHLLEKAPQPDPSPGLISGYGRCGGVQTETGVLRNVLRHAGCKTPSGEPFSEALVHGLCGGIGFLYAVFEYAGHPPMLTIVGRSRSMPDKFATEGLSRAGVNTTVSETGAAKKARATLEAALEAGRPALCIVDAAALSYYGLPADMLGMGPHVIAAIGRDADDVWIDDRGARPIRVSMDTLASARAGYKKAKHRLVTVERASYFDLAAAVQDAIRFTVRSYDEPPAKPFASNVGTAGLEKWARLLSDRKDKKSWSKVFTPAANAYVGLRRLYDCTQHDYTAPDAGRPMYADFLEEAAALTNIAGLKNVAEQMRDIGALWASLSARIADCGDKALAKGCSLSDRRAERLDASGGDASSEMAGLWRERRALANSCELTTESANELYGELASIVADIATRERDAIDALGALI